MRRGHLRNAVCLPYRDGFAHDEAGLCRIGDGDCRHSRDNLGLRLYPSLQPPDRLQGYGPLRITCLARDRLCRGGTSLLPDLPWAALDRLGPSLAEASRLSGATPTQHLQRVVVPLIRRAVTVAFGVTLIRSIFELPMAQFLMPSAGPSLAALIVNDFTQDRDAVACALALVTLVAVAVVAAIGAAINKLQTDRRVDREPARS
ncbi:ABC transporter permease subunit [Rhizobium sp. BK068]|uniref:ABC transporter permease subunit n=1 Tax=unclassified Rhizobium TaxID=2613769 RepID=UPI001FDF3745|nr:ABC transporter permease subunit [Rhizobium sp. BK068]